MKSLKKQVLNWKFGATNYLLLILIILSAHPSVFALQRKPTEYHVSKKGNDRFNGSKKAPFLSISHAASIAKAGDMITVHQGIYREMVRPLSGGISSDKRIVYLAAAGEVVEIKGSEVVDGWMAAGGRGVWKKVIPNRFFGDYNPYSDPIYGDWFFQGKGNTPHTGEVYIDGKSLYEVFSLTAVQKGEGVVSPVGVGPGSVLAPSFVWYGEVGSDSTTIYANFQDQNPNGGRVEINVRPSCFYPARTGVNYITVRGFVFSQAATQWAAPTAEQVGMIGTNWSKGWIIENNVVRDSKCVGITLGKDRASGQNVWSAQPEIDGAVHYNEVTRRVIADGWSKEKIGSHVVRNNTIYNCAEAGICGSFGAVFSEITGNRIYDVYTYRTFWGAEMAGIKIHAGIDVLISGNCVSNTNIGIWLDWMTQGTRVTGNVCFDNDFVDFMPEVNHGPYLVDNNIFLSPFAVKDWSQGGAYTHNLFAGMISRSVQGRATPFFKPHSSVLAGSSDIKGGDNRFYNNIFVGNAGKNFSGRPKIYSTPSAIDPIGGYGLAIYDDAKLPVVAGGNLYLKGAYHLKSEKGYVLLPEFDPGISLSDEKGALRLNLSFPVLPVEALRVLVNADLLGTTVISSQGFDKIGGKYFAMDKDFSGRLRRLNSCPGPFGALAGGVQSIKIWEAGM